MHIVVSAELNDFDPALIKNWSSDFSFGMSENGISNYAHIMVWARFRVFDGTTNQLLSIISRNGAQCPISSSWDFNLNGHLEFTEAFDSLYFIFNSNGFADQGSLHDPNDPDSFLNLPLFMCSTL